MKASILHIFASIVLVLHAPLLSFAQKATIGFKTGVQLSNIEPALHGTYDTDYAINPLTGLVLNLQVHNNWSIQSGLMYAAKGFWMHHSGTRFRYRFHHVEMPLNTVYHWKGQAGKWKLHAGIRFGYGLRGNVKAHNAKTTVTPEKVVGIENWLNVIGLGSSNNVEVDNLPHKAPLYFHNKDYYFKAFNTGLNIGIGYQKGRFLFQAEYSQDFFHKLEHEIYSTWTPWLLLDSTNTNTQFPTPQYEGELLRAKQNHHLFSFSVTYFPRRFMEKAQHKVTYSFQVRPLVTFNWAVSKSGNYKPNIGLSMGLLASFKLKNPTWTLQTGIFHEHKRFTLDNEGIQRYPGFYLPSSSPFDLKYLTVPLTLRVHKQRKIDYFFDFGAYGSLLMRATLHATGNKEGFPGQIDEGNVFDATLTPHLRTVNLGIVGGGGIAIPISDMAKLTLDVTYYQSVWNGSQYRRSYNGDSTFMIPRRPSPRPNDHDLVEIFPVSNAALHLGTLQFGMGLEVGF